MRRAFLVAVALLGGLACAGDDETPAPDYAEPCSVTEACREGLQCINELCTAPCAGDNECRTIDANSICQFGYCYVACTSSCPNGLTCTMNMSAQGTCR